jgi:hypothetical protein
MREICIEKVARWLKIEQFGELIERGINSDDVLKGSEWLESDEVIVRYIQMLNVNVTLDTH